MSATAEQVMIKAKEAKQVQNVLRRLGWDESKIEYNAGGRWTDENLEFDQNRLAVYRLLVKVKWNPDAEPNSWWDVPPVYIMSILADPSLAAVDKVAKIFNACNGTDWPNYTQDTIEANTNTFLAGLLAG